MSYGPIPCGSGNEEEPSDNIEQQSSAFRELEDYAAKLAGIEAERDMLRDCLLRAHSEIEWWANEHDCCKGHEKPLLDEIEKLLWDCKACGGSGLDAPHTDRWCDACAGTGVRKEAL